MIKQLSSASLFTQIQTNNSNEHYQIKAKHLFYLIFFRTFRKCSPFALTYQHIWEREMCAMESLMDIEMRARERERASEKRIRGIRMKTATAASTADSTVHVKCCEIDWLHVHQDLMYSSYLIIINFIRWTQNRTHTHIFTFPNRWIY